MDTGSIITHAISDPLLAGAAIVAWCIAARRHPRWGWDCVAAAFSLMVVRRALGYLADADVIEPEWRTVERALLVLISFLLLTGVLRIHREVA